MVQERGRGIGVTPPYHHDPGHRHDTSPAHYDTDLIENDGVRYTLATLQVTSFSQRSSAGIIILGFDPHRRQCMEGWGRGGLKVKGRTHFFSGGAHLILGVGW